MTQPTSRPPVERKVKAAALGALGTGILVSIVLAVAQAIAGNPHLLDGLPPWVKTVALAAISAVAAYVGGYSARHTPRSDPDAQQ